jgi:glycerol uptake facilitator-like aquaporin
LEGKMVYLILFAIFGGTIASLVFLLIYKRHIKKYDTIKEKSFIINSPKIFGTINLILALVFGIWFIINPSVFSQNETIENKIVYILFSIFAMYFYVLALPLSIGSTVLTLFLKKNLSKLRFLYYTITNITASIILFGLTYFILRK